MTNKRDSAADDLVAAEVAGHPLIAQVGPFTDTQRLCARLGVDDQALHDRWKQRTLLACQDSDGNLYWPTWQFTADMKPIPGLGRVLHMWTNTAVDGWAIGHWLTTPLAALDGAAARDWLRAGKPIEPLMGAARRQAGRDGNPGSGT